MEKIFYKETLIGILITSVENGSIPITDPSEPVQVVTLKHPQGTYLKSHTHSPTPRTTGHLQECLMVKKGLVNIDLYGPDKKLFKTIPLKEGQFFLLTKGGYGIRIIEDSELIEVKNGPFIEDKVLI